MDRFPGECGGSEARWSSDRASQVFEEGQIHLDYIATSLVPRLFHYFVPVAVESSGVLGPEALHFIRGICGCAPPSLTAPTLA